MVTRLIVRGISFKEIATQLKMADATVSSHFGHVALVVGVATRAEIVRWAMTYPEALKGEYVPVDLHPDGCPCERPWCLWDRLSSTL